jgi:peptidoglycan/xylan/chitin deacetylase (PgdA/CDA1 family)
MHRFLKKTWGMFCVAIEPFVRSLQGKKIVFCYHRICFQKPKSLIPHLTSNYVEVGLLERQLRWLCSMGKARRLDELLSAGPKAGSDFEFSITFDDGYRDVIENGLPLLQKFNVPCTIFVNSHFASNQSIAQWTEVVNNAALNLRQGISIVVNNDLYTYNMAKPKDRMRFVNEMRLAFRSFGRRVCLKLLDQLTALLDKNGIVYCNESLTLDDIKSTSRLGIVEFGGHSASHVNLAMCDEDELFFEIIKERDLLSEIVPMGVRYFSYPYGKRRYRSALAMEFVKKAGYVNAFTIEPGFLMTTYDPYQMPRLAVDGDWDMLTFQGKLLGMNIYKLLARVKEGSSYP